jgi:hypothetical protein
MTELDNLKAFLRQEVGIEPLEFTTDTECAGLTAAKTCSVTGQRYSVTVPIEAYEAWRNGMVAQQAFPMLSADEREFLISGNTPAEYERIFGGDEDEDDV